VAGKTVIATIARNMMSDENAISGLDVRDELTRFHDNSSGFVAEDKRSAFNPVPLKKIAAAKTAGYNLDKDVMVTYFRFRAFLDPDVAIAIVDANLHFFFISR
jgi:hypothetical protein